MICVFIEGIATGDCELPGYKDWFVASSVSFGVNHIELSKERDDLGTAIRVDKGAEDKGQEVSIGKSVDSVTCDLMQQAMKHRYTRVGDRRQLLKVDIHFVETFDHKPKAYLLIHLEDVLFKSWSINGDDDSRPSESLGLWCDKVAINYMAATRDGLIRKGPRGWDQGEANAPWSISTAKFPDSGNYPP